MFAMSDRARGMLGFDRRTLHLPEPPEEVGRAPPKVPSGWEGFFSSTASSSAWGLDSTLTDALDAAMQLTCE